MGIGLIVVIIVLCLDKTSYLLNLYVQSFGIYLQNLPRLSYNTDAFEQVGSSSGGEDRNRFVPDGFETTDGPKEWMNNWTFFYWGWWISYTPLSGRYTLKLKSFDLDILKNNFSYQILN